jgi:hypothetical protein
MRGTVRRSQGTGQRRGPGRPPGPSSTPRAPQPPRGSPRGLPPLDGSHAPSHENLTHGSVRYHEPLVVPPDGRRHVGPSPAAPLPAEWFVPPPLWSHDGPVHPPGRAAWLPPGYVPGGLLPPFRAFDAATSVYLNSRLVSQALQLGTHLLRLMTAISGVQILPSIFPGVVGGLQGADRSFRVLAHRAARLLDLGLDRAPTLHMALHVAPNIPPGEFADLIGAPLTPMSPPREGGHSEPLSDSEEDRLALHPGEANTDRILDALFRTEDGLAEAGWSSAHCSPRARGYPPRRVGPRLRCNRRRPRQRHAHVLTVRSRVAPVTDVAPLSLSFSPGRMPCIPPPAHYTLWLAASCCAFQVPSGHSVMAPRCPAEYAPTVLPHPPNEQRPLSGTHPLRV